MLHCPCALNVTAYDEYNSPPWFIPSDMSYRFKCIGIHHILYYVIFNFAYIYLHAYWGQKAMLGVCLLSLFETGPLVDPRSTSCLDWLASKCWGLAWLCIASAKVTGTHHHAWLLPGYWTKSSWLYNRHFTERVNSSDPQMPYIIYSSTGYLGPSWFYCYSRQCCPEHPWTMP